MKFFILACVIAILSGIVYKLFEIFVKGDGDV